MLHLFPPKKENNYLTFHEQIHNRVFRISIFREKMCPCKKPFGNHILIIFTLKKDFFHIFFVSVAVCHEQKPL